VTSRLSNVHFRPEADTPLCAAVLTY